jgi:hypothetical protein
VLVAKSSRRHRAERQLLSLRGFMKSPSRRLRAPVLFWAMRLPERFVSVTFLAYSVPQCVPLSMSRRSRR